MSGPPSARDEPGDLEDLPDWVKALGLPAEAAAAIDRWWKPVWETIADQLALLPAHPRPAPAAGGERIEFEAVEELEPGDEVAGALRGDVAGVPGVVPARGRGGAARPGRGAGGRSRATCRSWCRPTSGWWSSRAATSSPRGC